MYSQDHLPSTWIFKTISWMLNISYLEKMGMAPALLSISSCAIIYLEDMGMAPATLLNRPLLSS